MKDKFCLYCMNPKDGNTCNHCGKSSSQYQFAPHHLTPGTILAEKYLVGAAIGEGGFGITYIGRDINLDLKIAIKEYYPSGVVNRNNTSSTEISAHMGKDQDFFEKGKKSFLAEARTLAKFSNEPSIVSVRDFFSENNTTYIVMEYLEGIDLREYLEQNGRMSFAQTVEMLSPIMKALTKIHDQGLIHRDISPANIMILKDGSVKLLDFGAARDVSGADEKSLSILLKPGFAPEEQYRSKGHQGPWTDVYALSATMYKMMTGVTPDDAMNRLFSDDIKKITELNLKVTTSQNEVVLKGMAVHQENRWQNIGELYTACKDVLFEKDKVMKEEEFKVIKEEEKTIRQVSKQVKPQKEDNIKHIKERKEKDVNQNYINKEKNVKKPNIICFIASIFTALITLFSMYSIHVAYSDPYFEGKGYSIVFTIIFLGLTVLLGYFYYPRLERKVKKKYIKIFSGMAVACVAVLVIGIAVTSLSSISIGDEKIKRNEINISLVGDVITDNDLAKLKEFKKLESLEIFECFLDNEDLKVLSELTQLKRLSISGNTDITDISLLNNLENLEYLNISITGVEDISCLDKLTNLQTLVLGYTNVSDLSSLQNFTVLNALNIESLSKLDPSTIKLPASLETIYCSGNNLDNLSFLNSVDSLVNILASRNNISDLSPLSRFDRLYNCDLSVNNISDISMLPVDNLNDLDLSTNSIVDISRIHDMEYISTLDLAYNQITDISALEGCNKLHNLKLNNNSISDISAIKDCFRIHTLDISYNQVSDISVVSTIDELERFTARSNKITDISPLASCETLKTKSTSLDLRDNQITDISALAGYVGPKFIYLSNNAISDISPLGSCTNVTHIWINNNQVSDVSVLGTLSSLKVLNIVGNPLSDVSALNLMGAEGVLEHATLCISYNENIDWALLNTKEYWRVYVYDVPEREKEMFYESNTDPLAYAGSADEAELDEVVENEDLVETTTEEGEDNNG